MINGLRGALGGWGARGMLGQVLVMLLYRRLGGIVARMERLVQRFQAGRLVGREPRLVVSPRTPVDGDVQRCRLDKPVLPRGFGWLVRLASYRAAGYGSQLRAILETPDMVALLVAAPQAGRILRPLCRMLAVEVVLLRPRIAGDVAETVSVVSAEEAACVASRKRMRVVRKAVDWGRIPLPRGVLAVARRQGFGKVR